MALSGLGFCAEQSGDLVAARELHTDELQLAKAFGDPRAVALALEGLAAVELGDEDPLAALRLLGEADELRRSAGGPLPAAERIDASCRSIIVNVASIGENTAIDGIASSANGPQPA